MVLKCIQLLAFLPAEFHFLATIDRILSLWSTYVFLVYNIEERWYYLSTLLFITYYGWVISSYIGTGWSQFGYALVLIKYSN